ncbi:Cell surface protein [Acidisarcina polymorpha]|uniref:Cell surface protein n=1 Tax=Acidisarcina polymorpha TaxID=2211140 RepID=A0A2Z5G7T5_9BACT|nr:Ig-like domain repeat protein [Acidisarcina polymorpha]AXC15040.1 Cell surface protein [Acidisarcina polymorpha]
MKALLPVTLSLSVLSSLFSYSQTTSQNHQVNRASGAAAAGVTANYGKLPLTFEENQGQTDPRVRFASRGQNYSLFLTDSEAVLALTKRDSTRMSSAKTFPAAVKTDVIRMELAGASHELKVDGAEALPGKVNYFVGNDPAKWHRNVPTFAKVKYSGVYAGVDLVYYGNQRQLEYDFVVAPGADPKIVRLHFGGASKLTLGSGGDLNIAAKNGTVVFHKPVVYQVKDGERERVDGRFQMLAKNTVGFQLGAFDPSREVVIDPTVVYSTYLGGSGIGYDDGGDGSSSGDGIGGVVVDAEGCAYVTGAANSLDFPVTPHAFQKTNPITKPGYYEQVTESFITKFNPAGSALVYSTYFGGTGTDYTDLSNGIGDIAIDASGNVYATGTASTLDFPTTPVAYDRVASQAGKAFVSKLDSTGSTLIYSTLLGGSQGEFGLGIAVSPAGNAYVSGRTYSTDFPITPNAFQRVDKAARGSATGFVTELNSTGSGLIYSTFLSGSSYVSAEAIFLDKAGDAFIGGTTDSTDFPITPGAYDRVFKFTGDNLTGFVTKLNPEGSKLIYSTYFPQGSIAVDPSGNVYGVATAGPVTARAIQSKGGDWVGKLNASGTALVYGTYLLPSDAYVDGEDGLSAIAVDPLGHAFVAGYDSAPGFPVTPDAFQPTFKGALNEEGSYPPNAVFAELNTDGTAVLYGTYLGGSGSLIGAASPIVLGDGATAIGLDTAGNAYVVGTTASADFPVTRGAFQSTNHAAAIGNGFITKFALHGGTTTTLTSNSAIYQRGENAILTAHVTPLTGSSVPPGNIDFIINGASAAKVPLDNTGRAVYTTDSLPIGENAIVASYFGDLPEYSSSNGAITVAVPGQVATPTFPKLGGTYPALFQVAIECSTPGALIYYTTDGSTPVVSPYGLYTNPVFIFYPVNTVKAIALLPESGFTPSAVATAVYTINAKAIPTTTTVKSLSNPSALGEPVTFVATVTAASGPTPTGAVTFKNGAASVGTAPLVKGVATFSLSGLGLYGHSITAYYTGSATNTASAVGFTQEVTE